MMNENKVNFCRLLRSTERQNIGKVIAELEKLGFFEAPGSQKVHNAFPGGLVTHSLNVYRVARELSLTMRNIVPDLEVRDDSIIITSLLHDVCKAPRYQDTVLLDGVYQKNYSHLPVGHGEKSVIMLLRWGLELTDDEILAIRWHMGAWQIALHNEEMKKDYLYATHATPLLPIIEAADKLAAQILSESRL